MKFVQATLISLLAVLAPIKPVLLVTGFLICADLLTGLIAAKKRGEKITSSGLRRTLSKVVIYNIAVISGFLIEKFMLSDLVPVVKIVSSIIGIHEGLSIFENLNVISGDNVFKKVTDMLGSENKGDSKEPPKS